jgi:hypothetical protein
MKKSKCKCKKCNNYIFNEIERTAYAVCIYCNDLISGITETTRPIVSLSRW